MILESSRNAKLRRTDWGLAAERKLFDAALDVPSGMRTIVEEADVAGAVAGRTHRIVFKHDRAFDDQDGLVDIIEPVELPLALRDRITLDDPGGLDRRRGQIDGDVKLSDDELDKINARREQLEEKIQERYGIAKDQAKKDVDAWYNSIKW